MPPSKSGDEIAADVGGWVGVAIASVVITAVLVAIQIVVMEAIRIYRGRPFPGAGRCQVLWWALAGFLLSLVAAAAMTNVPSLMPLALWPASVGFLIWIVVIEWVDLTSGENSGSAESLDDVLGPWRLFPQTEE